MSEETVVIRIGDDKGARRSKFRIDEGDFSAVVMPLRIKRDSQGNIERVHDRLKDRAEAKEIEQHMSGSTA